MDLVVCMLYVWMSVICMYVLYVFYMYVICMHACYMYICLYVSRRHSDHTHHCSGSPASAPGSPLLSYAPIVPFTPAAGRPH